MHDKEISFNFHKERNVDGPEGQYGKRKERKILHDIMFM
jgi:hypothetical protein